MTRPRPKKNPLPPAGEGRVRGAARTTLLILALLLATPAPAATLSGAAAYGDWTTDSPGTTRLIRPDDLPPAYATRSASNAPGVADPPPGAAPHVPAGFAVSRFAAGFENPRMIRTAPNGDIFLAETSAGRIRVLRAPGGAIHPVASEVFATGLDVPFGIAFYPPGPHPHFVYVAETNAIVRFPYDGGLHPTGPAQTIVPRLAGTGGGHITRDIAFSPDGTKMYVSVGSGSNVAQGLPRWDLARIDAWQAARGLGAAWGDEANRADVLVFDPDGRNAQIFAAGIRNCVGLAIQPVTSDLWCSTNERDGLGDNVPPDYVTRVRPGAFYGWPWYYTGNHEDPRHKDERPDLAGQVTTPDVLLQPHSAPLAMAFYPPAQSGPAAFPAAYRGDAFVALHGSWNRSKRTGYKIVRIHLQDGIPTGTYEDFLTGFVIGNDDVWGRPVGVTIAQDGALLVTEDANGTIWRITPAPPPG